MVKRLLVSGLIAVTFAGVGEIAAPAITANAISRNVVIAVNYGHKAHHGKHCRGLNRARRHPKKYVSTNWAKSNHYPKCKWCHWK